MCVRETEGGAERKKGRYLGRQSICVREGGAERKKGDMCVCVLA